VDARGTAERVLLARHGLAFERIVLQECASLMARTTLARVFRILMPATSHRELHGG
jgi:hypothetical protein